MKEQNHKKFAMGQNPMEQTPFEREASRKEVVERTTARVKYIHGIQGRDGGSCEEYKRLQDPMP